MSNPAHPAAGTTAASRAIYYSPQKAFDRPVSPILPVVVADERAKAFDPACPSGFIPCDQSAHLGCDWLHVSEHQDRPIAQQAEVTPGPVQ